MSQTYQVGKTYKWEVTRPKNNWKYRWEMYEPGEKDSAAMSNKPWITFTGDVSGKHRLVLTETNVAGKAWPSEQTITFVSSAPDPPPDPPAAPTAARVEIDVPTPPDVLAMGDTMQLTGRAVDAAGTPVAATLKWTSNDGEIATVSQSGLVMARQAGEALITASAGSVTGKVTLKIHKHGAVERIEIEPPEAEIEVGAMLQLTAIAYDAKNRTCKCEKQWSSSDPKVIALMGAGMVHALAAGTATVEARFEGIVGTARVVAKAKVVDPPVQDTKVARVVPTLSPATAQEGDTVTATAKVLNAAGEELKGKTVKWSSSDSAVAEIAA